MVKVPTGGRKKKLKASIAAIEVATATHNRDVAATTRTTISSVVETVAALADGQPSGERDRDDDDASEAHRKRRTASDGVAGHVARS